jgi:hypothetical protein
MDLKSTSVASEKLHAAYVFLRWLLQGLDLASHMHNENESKLQSTLSANSEEDDDYLDESFRSSTLDKNISLVQLPAKNRQPMIAKEREAFITTNEELSDSENPVFHIRRKKSRNTIKVSFCCFHLPCSFNFTFFHSHLSEDLSVLSMILNSSMFHSQEVIKFDYFS